MNARTIRHLQAADPVLERLIQRLGPIRLEPRRLPSFQSLVQAIIHQQLSGKAAGTILGRFVALFPNGSFPTPEQVAGADFDQLRSVGLSRSKTGYVKDVAEKTLAGLVPSLDECDELTDKEIVDRLVQIKGVGRWTVEMLLIFNLGRTDVLPIHDLGVRRGFQIAYRKRAAPTPEQLDRYGERWRPFRTTAAWYLWRAVDSLGGGEW